MTYNQNKGEIMKALKLIPREEKRAMSSYNWYDFTDTNDIKRNHRGHWFSKDTMRFFQSRISETVYYGKDLLFFVSSEKDRWDNPRMYTVRSYDPKTDQIDTVGEYQAYKSRSGAASAAERVALDSFHALEEVSA